MASRLKNNQAQRYWEKLKDFLDKSGKFFQTWHLYVAIEEDLKTGKDVSPEVRQAQGYHIHLMTAKHKCKTPDELYMKAAGEWNDFKRAFNALRAVAIEADVDPRISDGYAKTFMSAFVHEDWDGPCRREFYRNKFVKKALLKLDKDSYVEPINIREMEKAFAENESYKVNFKKKREKAKARDRENRVARMSPNKALS